MTPRQIYLKAAERIAAGRQDFACWAIDGVVREQRSQERESFADVFEPRSEEEREGFYCNGWLEQINEPAEDARHRRVVALCLMAAMSSK